MNDPYTFLKILGYATLPAAGNMLGIFLARLIALPRWIIGVLLHSSAGVAMGLIALELMPRIQETTPLVELVLAIFAGAALSLLLFYAARHLAGRTGGRAGTWMVFAALGADLTTDGLMTGAGSAASLKLGALLAGAQLVANIPGGFAAGSNLRRTDLGARSLWAAGGTVSLCAFVSAGLGYLILRDANDQMRGASLTLVTGLLLVATLEDLVPEGDAPKPPRWGSTLAIAVGFCALAGVAALSGP